MKVLIYSDLHTEFRNFIPKKEVLDAVELIIQVGDLNFTPYNIKLLKSWKIPVIFIPGNHDFWNPIKVIDNDKYCVYEYTIEEAVSKMKEMAENSLVRVLYNEVYEVNNIQFIGSTMWYDANKLSPKQVNLINDYSRIYKSKDRLIKPFDICLEHTKAVKFIESTLKEPYQGKRALLTHHPAWIPPEIINSNHSMPYAYSTDLTYLWRDKIDIMVHGHIHTFIDKMNKNTHIICNPRGYPRDDSKNIFREKLIVNI